MNLKTISVNLGPGLRRVALSCSHWDVVNQTLQIRRIRYRSSIALSSQILQIIDNVRMSDIIICLTLGLRAYFSIRITVLTCCRCHRFRVKYLTK